jgi:hypothetical protein
MAKSTPPKRTKTRKPGQLTKAPDGSRRAEEPARDEARHEPAALKGGQCSVPRRPPRPDVRRSPRAVSVAITPRHWTPLTARGARG